MKIEVYPEGTLRTSVPTNIFIREVTSKPKVEVESLGRVDVKNYGDHFKAEFWVQEPGKYEVTVKGMGQDSGQNWSRIITYEEQTYLSFGLEFGFFLVILTFAFFGVFTWLKRVRN